MVESSGTHPKIDEKTNSRQKQNKSEQLNSNMEKGVQGVNM